MARFLIFLALLTVAFVLIRRNLRSNRQASKPSSDINEEEALNVLGLQKSHTKEDVIESHRKLMQKLHPDRGGNDYLATKINQAKDLLLKKL